MINQIIKGMLSREEVAEGLRERGLAVSKDNIDKFFFRVDSNRDGMICEKEYNKFVIERVEECRSVYKKVDENGDGRLTAAELRSAASELGFSISSEQLRFLLNKILRILLQGPKKGIFSENLFWQHLH